MVVQRVCLITTNLVLGTKAVLACASNAMHQRAIRGGAIVFSALQIHPTLRVVPTAADFLTVEEFATLLRLPPSTAYELTRRGVVPSVKLGRHRRIRRDFVDMLGRDGPVVHSEPSLAHSDLGTVPVSPDWLTVEEVASILRQPLSTTYEQVRLGRISSVKLGKHRRVRRSVIDGLGR